MLDDALLIAVLSIFAATILAALIAGRVRDPCLKQWSGYPVRVALLRGDQIRGRMHDETSGIEFYVDEALAETSGRHSFVLYKEEYGEIVTIVRFLDELTADQRRRRDGALRHAYHPGPLRRGARTARNWLNTLKDAAGDAASVVVKSSGPVGMAGQSGRVSATSATVLGAVGRAYDPLLERHIGSKVILVVGADDDRTEYVGTFREYSGQFLSVVDVDLKDGSQTRTGDVIASRPRAAIRHAAESR